MVIAQFRRAQWYWCSEAECDWIAKPLSSVRWTKHMLPDQSNHHRWISACGPSKACKAGIWHLTPAGQGCECDVWRKDLRTGLQANGLLEPDDLEEVSCSGTFAQFQKHECIYEHMYAGRDVVPWVLEAVTPYLGNVMLTCNTQCYACCA